MRAGMIHRGGEQCAPDAKAPRVWQGNKPAQLTFITPVDHRRDAERFFVSLGKPDPAAMVSLLKRGFVNRLPYMVEEVLAETRTVRRIAEPVQVNDEGGIAAAPFVPQANGFRVWRVL